MEKRRSSSKVQLASQFTTNLRHDTILHRTVLLCERYTHHLSLLSRNTLWSLIFVIFVMYVLPCCTWLLSVFLFLFFLSILIRAFVRNSFILLLLSYVYRGDPLIFHCCISQVQAMVPALAPAMVPTLLPAMVPVMVPAPVWRSSQWSESRSPPRGASCYIQDFHSWLLGFFYASRERLSLALRTTADKSYHKMRYALCWMYSSCVWTRHTSLGLSLAMDRWLTLRLLLKMGNLDDDDDDDVWTFLS